MKSIGPSFEVELIAAGVQDWRFSWGPDGAITFTGPVAQSEQDKVAAVYAAHNPAALWPTVSDLEASALAAMNGAASGLLSVDPMKLFKAKFISDLAFRLAKAPGALTAQEINNERARIAAIYKAL